jgi:hypothetical protein
MALRDVLANHYYGQAEAETIARVAGIDVAGLAVAVPSAALWQEILAAAWSSNRLPALFEAAGTAAWLDEAVQDYWISLSLNPPADMACFC